MRIFQHVNLLLVRLQWRIQGRGLGRPAPPPPPLVFRPKWGAKGRKKNFWDRPIPSPLPLPQGLYFRASPYLKVWTRHWFPFYIWCVVRFKTPLFTDRLLRFQTSKAMYVCNDAAGTESLSYSQGRSSVPTEILLINWLFEKWLR